MTVIFLLMVNEASFYVPLLFWIEYEHPDPIWQLKSCQVT